ncbi:MAG: L,D-transpeptidase family protein [Halothece sp.]
MSRNAKKVHPFALASFLTRVIGIAVAIPVIMQTTVVSALPAELAQKLANLKQSQQRWLEVDLSEQTLTAWQGGTKNYTTIVSTGKPDTPTHTGIFTIQRKLPQDRMRGEDYNLPNVPHVMYYHRGYAIHGAYWHHQFGTPVSHGCVNLPLPAAEEIYEWIPMKTPVVIHE